MAKEDEEEGEEVALNPVNDLDLDEQEEEEPIQEEIPLPTAIVVPVATGTAAPPPESAVVTVRQKKTKLEDELKIPRLFFQLYFGIGALVYSMQTLWLLIACCFDKASFTTSGFFYMAWITVLMWLSTGLTVACFKFGLLLTVKDAHGRNRMRFGLAIFFKVCVDAMIFHATIVALCDPTLDHYHEFSQFVGPLIYYGLLYLVTIIEVGVFYLTIMLVEDPCGFFPFMEKMIKYKKELEEKYGEPKE